MVSCLLCLEMNKDTSDCIKANSIRWQELEIGKIIEKHFWSLNTSQPRSWLCLSCWREVNDFHKFFLRIEEAHAKFDEIKVEDYAVSSVDCKEEITIQRLNFKENEGWDEDNMTLCYLEPEILIDQTEQQDFAELEIIIEQEPSQDLEDGQETVNIEPLDELHLENISPKQANSQLRTQDDIAVKDPLEKPKKKKNSNAKIPAESEITKENNADDLKVKEELVGSDSDNFDCISDKDNFSTDVNYEPNKDSSGTAENHRNKGCNGQRMSIKENDKFISQHIEEMSCDLCQEQFRNFDSLQKHFNKIHNQRGYVVCCERKFFIRTRLVDHLHRHLNPDYFKCNECGKAMSTRLTFVEHMMRVHRADEVVRQHFCDVCGRSFIKASVLRLHKLTHLSEEEKKFHCEDCGKNYGSAYVLKRHKQSVHLKSYVKICYICGKAINSSAKFKLHMDKHEGVSLPSKNCDICGIRLTSERGLMRHKETQHPVGGKLEHRCPICPKISPTKKALKKHIKTMHENSSRHKCTICERAFKRAENLREHMATHTGTPLYTCPWCPKTFNSNSNMHNHRKKKHPIENAQSKLQKYSGNIPPEI